MSALQEYAAAHKEEMNRMEVINALSSVFSDCQKRSLLHTSPEVYLKLIAFLITVIENRNTIPICFAHSRWITRSCVSSVLGRLVQLAKVGRREEVSRIRDQAHFRVQVRDQYASFPISTLGTKGCPYSEAELHSIFTLAVDYMSPLVERPLSQIVDGIVMTSCTLSSIPSFTVRVVSVLKVGPVFRSNVGVAEHSAHPQLLPEARRAHPAVHLRSSHPSPPP